MKKINSRINNNTSNNTSASRRTLLVVVLPLFPFLLTGWYHNKRNVEGFISPSMVTDKLDPSPSSNSKIMSGNAEMTDFPTTKNPGEDTAIIITSSWIKSFPTLYFINKVVESLQLIEGLSPLAPLYIAIDGLRLKGLDHQEIEERLEQLDRYVKLLYHRYDLPNSTNVHIIASQKHLHISGNVQKMLALIEDHHPSVKYLYYLQHDFSFRTGVNHKALIEVVQENKNINLVRFLYKYGLNERNHFCRNTTSIKSRGLVLHPTNKYSDNNHFARFDYYKHIMDKLGTVPRAPEGPLQNMSGRESNCSNLGMWVYHTALDQTVTLNHLDGRKTDAITIGNITSF